MTAITSNPQIKGGEPCIAGTRIPARQIAAMHAAGDAVSTLMRAYNLTAEQVEAAIAWAAANPICGDRWESLDGDYVCELRPGHAGYHAALPGIDGDSIPMWRSELRVTIARSVDVALEDLTDDELEAWAASLNAEQAREWVRKLARSMLRSAK